MDSLPNELLFEILRQCPDVSTVLSLSSVSQKLQAVYQNTQKSVLSAICWNQIHPVVLPDAIDALEQRRHRVYRQKTSVFAYLNTFPRRSLKNSEFSLEGSQALLKFHQIVQYHIDDYVHTRLTMINQFGHKHEPAPLSTTEYIRLARAFYRLELYGNLFYMSRPMTEVIPATDQCTLFFQRLKDWELEEMLCVRKYLFSKLRKFLNRVEDYVFEKIVEDYPTFMLPTGSRNPWESNYMFFSRLWFFRGQDDWIDGFLTQGLQKIMEILTTSEETLWNVFDGSGSPESNFVEALKLLPPPSNVRSVSVFSLDNYPGHPIKYKETYEASNCGWTWLVTRFGPPSYTRNALQIPHLSWLQQWGFAIWDYDRLLKHDVITKRKVFSHSYGLDEI